MIQFKITTKDFPENLSNYIKGQIYVFIINKFYFHNY